MRCINLLGLFVISLLLFMGHLAKGQPTDGLLTLQLKQDYRVDVFPVQGERTVLSSGTTFEIQRVRRSPTTTRMEILIRANDRNYSANQDILQSVYFDTEQYSLADIWTFYFLRSEAASQFYRNGLDLENRRELESEYQFLNEKLDFLEDDFLTDYIHALSEKLLPGGFAETFPATLRIRIYHSLEPAAFSLSNGELYLSTGLIGALRSEDELMAVICLELAHIYMDHPLINYRQLLRSQRRRDFWAGVATLGAAVVEGYAYGSAASRNQLSPVDYAFAGSFTYNVALLSFGIANSISNRIGLNYTKEQKEEALALSKHVFAKIQKDTAAFGLVYGRIWDYFNMQAPHRMIHEKTFRFDHANENGLLSDLKQNASFHAVDPSFMNTLQSLNIGTAFREFNDRNFEYAKTLIDSYLDSEYATFLEWYILNAMWHRAVPNTKEDKVEALNLLMDARESAPFVPIDTDKEIALLYYRIGDIPSARSFVEAYRKTLLENPDINAGSNELRWTEHMLQIWR